MIGWRAFLASGATEQIGIWSTRGQLIPRTGREIYATSTDGFRWNKVPDPIFVHRGRLERQNIGTPSLWKVGAEWFLFYHAYDLTDVRIRLVRGPNLLQLGSAERRTVVDVGSPNTWDCGTTGKRSIIKEGDWYYMIFEGSTNAPFERAKWSSGVARSRDLVNWEK